MVTQLHDGLDKAYGAVQFNKDAESYLGMNIKRSGNGQLIQVDHSGSIKKLLEEHLDEKLKLCTSPQQEDLFQNNTESTDQGNLGEEEAKKYLSVVMSLMYIARLTRPDILLPVTYLATKSHSPVNSDWNKLVRVLRYLKGTPTDGITVNCTELQLHCHCDASYGLHPDGRSHTGFVVFMGRNGSYVHAKSNKQKTGSTSSTDAEVIALVDCMKVMVWLKNIMTELDRVPPDSVTIHKNIHDTNLIHVDVKNIGSQGAGIIYQDNQSATQMVNGTSKCSRSKHILTKINYAKDLIDSCQMKIEYLNTDDMSADLLTKPLSGKLYLKHREKIMGMLNESVVTYH
jgi:hypothetical protein